MPTCVEAGCLAKCDLNRGTIKPLYNVIHGLILIVTPVTHFLEGSAKKES